MKEDLNIFVYDEICVSEGSDSPETFPILSEVKAWVEKTIGVFQTVQNFIAHSGNAPSLNINFYIKSYAMNF